jgi:hypothetical protein
MFSDSKGILHGPVPKDTSYAALVLIIFCSWLIVLRYCSLAQFSIELVDAKLQ